MNGEETTVSAYKIDTLGIKRYVELLRTSSGNPIALIDELHSSSYPSIQGPWTPMSHTSPELYNNTDFPNVSTY